MEIGKTESPKVWSGSGPTGSALGQPVLSTHLARVAEHRPCGQLCHVQRPGQRRPLHGKSSGWWRGCEGTSGWASQGRGLSVISSKG